MGKDQGLAGQILDLVGGRDNIISVSHCLTRLRFYLRDRSLVDQEALNSLSGVIATVEGAGQFQVVLDKWVAEVHADLLAQAGLGLDVEPAADLRTVGLINRGIDILSGIFQPFLGILSASGVLKGMMALAVGLNWLSPTSDTYVFLYQIANALFFFLPVFIGYTAAQKFRLSPIIGMTIGLALVMPSLQLSSFEASFAAAGKLPDLIFAGTIFESEVYLRLFGIIPVVLNNYTTTVVPVIFVVAFAAWVHRRAKRIIPDLVQNFFLPLATILISIPIGFILIGPVITVLTNLAQGFFLAVLDFNPILYGFVLGAAWQVLVIFGLHWALIPLVYIQLSELGYSQVLSPVFAASFVQTAVVLAMFFKLKNPRLKALAVPAFISGLMGITEPAIYGLTLPSKRPFYYSLLAAGLGGVLMMAFDLVAYRSGGIGVWGIFKYISNQGDLSGLWRSLIAVTLASGLGFCLTYFGWKDDYIEPSQS